MVLLTVELLLRGVFLAQTRFYVWPPNLEKVFRPLPGALPGVTGNARFVTNSWGIRGDEFSRDQQYRILAIGGSTTECLYLDQSESWPGLLQDRLNRLKVINVWVGNVGASGKRIRDHVLQMQHLLPQYPRIDAVLMLVGVNDFILAAGDPKYDPHFWDRADAEAKQFVHAFTISPYDLYNPYNPYQRDSVFYKNLAIWRFARKVRNLYFNPDKGVFGGFLQDEAGRNYLEMRNHRKSASRLLEELPDLTEALAEYRRNLNHIVDLAQAKSVRLILLTQPSLWRADLTKAEQELLWFEGIVHDFAEGEKPYHTAGALAAGLDRYNRTLLEVCRTRGVECLDVAALLPKETSVFYDDVHFNEQGSARIAGVLAEYLQRSYPFVQR